MPIIKKKRSTTLLRVIHINWFPALFLVVTDSCACAYPTLVVLKSIFPLQAADTNGFRVVSGQTVLWLINPNQIINRFCHLL